MVLFCTELPCYSEDRDCILLMNAQLSLLAVVSGNLRVLSYIKTNANDTSRIKQPRSF